MQRVNLVDMYSTPDFYKPPPVDQLSTNTQYPNLNSLEYQKRTAPVTGTSVRRNYFDQLTVNELGNAVLVANRYTDRKWQGHFWGFECLEDVRGAETTTAATDKVSYELCCKDTVTGMRFVDDNMLLLADTAGTLALWSTKSAMRSPHGYCLFNVGQQSEHTGAITALDLFAAKRTNAVTGSADGCIKCWETGEGDLYSTQTYRAGHSRTITAVATAPYDSDVFASVSLDRSIHVWDRRVSRPIVAVNNDFATGLTSLVWSDSGRLYAGDEAGKVHSVDARKLDSLEGGWSPFVGTGADGGRVHRLKLDGGQQRLAVVADNTVVKVLDVSADGIAADVSNDRRAKVLKTPKSTDFVRDVHWGGDGVHLYTIGWGAALTRLVLKELQVSE